MIAIIDTVMPGIPYCQQNQDEYEEKDDAEEHVIDQGVRDKQVSDGKTNAWVVFHDFDVKGLTGFIFCIVQGFYRNFMLSIGEGLQGYFGCFRAERAHERVIHEYLIAVQSGKFVTG